MAAPKIADLAPTPEPTKTSSAENKTVEIGPDTRVESVAQYLDEYDPATAMQMMRAHIAMSDELRRMGRGRWEVPTKYRAMLQLGPDGRPLYRFIRLGTMSNVSRRDAILRQKFICEQMGWKVAPAGTRNSLYLTDGDQGVYMCIAEMAGKEHDESERKTRLELRRRRFTKSVSALPEDLAGLGGKNVSIEQLDISRGTMTAGEFNRSR